MASPFTEENTASRRRLESLAHSLSDQDLSRSTSSGWTTAALLAHLAFWDGRVLALLRHWKVAGVDESPIDADAVNDALKPLCLALNPHTAVELSISSAAAVDAQVETLTFDLMERIQKQLAATPFQFRLNRSLHRNGHLSEIESLLQPPSG